MNCSLKVGLINQTPIFGEFSMRVRSSLSPSQRLHLVELFEEGYGYAASANRLKISREVVRHLFRRWSLHGRLCLVEKPTKQFYSFETKKSIVDRALAGETYMALARQYNLSSSELVRTWVRAFRKDGYDGLKPKKKGRPTNSAIPVPLTEETKLRREVEKLRAENAYLKKLRDLRNQGHG